MSYYVQVQDGQVIGVPQPMSDNSSVSPNSHWGIDQLTSCGYVIVNPIPPVNYTVDLTTPTINSDGSVTYTFTPMTQQQLLDQAIQNFSWSTLMGTLFTTFGVVRAEQLGNVTIILKELVDYPNWPGVAQLLSVDTTLTSDEKIIVQNAFLDQGIDLTQIVIPT
jgi:hypothetical protein